MVNLGGAQSAIPREGAAIGSIAMARLEQFAVAALHQRQTLPHQADCPVPQRGGFPGIGGNAVGGKQVIGNRAVAGAGEMPVKRAQRRYQAVEPERAARLRSRSAVGGMIPEPEGRLDPMRRCKIHRQDRRYHRALGGRTREPELVAETRTPDEDVGAIQPVAANDMTRPLMWCESESCFSRRCRGQENDRWVCVGMPEDFGVIGALARVNQEIVTPSGVRLRRSRARRWPALPRGRFGNRDFVARTPRQNPHLKFEPRNHRRQVTSNLPSTSRNLPRRMLDTASSTARGGSIDGR